MIQEIDCSVFRLQFVSLSADMVFSDYAKQRILTLYWKGFKVSMIAEYLILEDGIRVSKQGTRHF